MTREDNIHTIAFYNTENLFDVYVDDKINDDDFLPIAAKNWTKQRYDKKIYNLGTAISKIGYDSTNKPPVLIGLAEVENDSVLADLINSKSLRSYNYGFVHFNSSDERGIDVALLYNKDNFIVEESEVHPIYIHEESGKRDFTRDILLVKGVLDGKKINVLVNHWPSRHEGKDETDFKRIIASTRVSELISILTAEDPSAQVIVMGDFNDNPNSPSILKLKSDSHLINTMESLWSYSRGSVSHKFSWILFDQILLTSNFLEQGEGPFELTKSDIFDERFLMQYVGKYKGQPSRTYLGKKYKGGFSDHFPVYIQIKMTRNA